MIDIPVDQMDPSPRNPRRAVGQVSELADSIREHGLLQPVVVRRHPTADDRYELIAGHRRLAAVRSLGWHSLPAVVRGAAADEAFLLTLIENLQRQDLSPREESAALEALVQERNWSTRQVADAVNRSQSYVSRRLRVFEDPVVGPLVLQGRLGISAAEELLPLRSERKRSFALRAAEQGWDRKRVRAAIREPNTGALPARAGGLLTRTRAFREALREAVPSRLTESERRELRLAFQDLAMLARAPGEPRATVFPPLPRVARNRAVRQ